MSLSNKKNRRIERLQILKDQFSLNELKEICYQLHIREEFDFNSRSAFARELIQYLERRGRIDELDKVISENQFPPVVNKESTQTLFQSPEALHLFRQQFFAALEADQLGSALHQLNSLYETKTSKHEVLIQLNARMRSLDAANQKGILSAQEYLLERNKLRVSIHSFWGRISS